VIRKAIIPAAGLGTRFYPITKCIPKEMLPILNKPIIHYVIEEARDSGIEDVAIITRRGKGVIEDYIDLVNLDLNICYIRQKEPLGLGDAILQGESFIGDEDFAVLLGDDIFVGETPGLSQLMNVYEKYKSSAIGLEILPDERLKDYGIVSGEKIESNLMNIKEIVEKPKIKLSSNLGIIGRYILENEIFSFLRNLKIEKRGEIELTDGLKQLKNIYGVILKGERYDCGNPKAYIHTIKSFCHF